MKYLVTGGAGFIGSTLATKLLEEGHEVIIVDDLSSGRKSNIPKGAEFIKGDIRSQKVFEQLPTELDAIFHLAANVDLRKSVLEPAEDAHINLLGTIHLLEFARKNGIKKFVFSSTGGAIYGEQGKVCSEEDSPKPEAPYAIGKWSAEQYIDLYNRLYGMQGVSLRYANVYGPGQTGSKESGVIAIFTERSKNGKEMVIFGDGEQTRDFVHVDDIVRANIACLDFDGTGTFNISTGIPMSLNQLLDILDTLQGKKHERVYQDQKAGDIKHSCLNNALAKKNLGWEPQIELKNGLKALLMPSL